MKTTLKAVKQVLEQTFLPSSSTFVLGALSQVVWGRDMSLLHICYPERIAKDPFDSSYDVKSWKWRIGAAESFSLKADQVCEALPQFMSRIDAEEEGAGQIAYPSQLSPMISEDYQRELYLLTAREANRRASIICGWTASVWIKPILMR